jgi:clan AA aspartic protease (TIGR02281 family)
MKYIFLVLLFFCFTTNIYSQSIIQMRKDGDIMKIPCKVNGLSLEFILDTGASSVSISLSEALFMIKNGYLKTDDILEKEKYMTANGTIADGTKILIHEIQIGDYKLQNITGNITHTLDAPLLLGNSVLSKLGDFNLNINNATLTINEGKSFDFNKDTLIASSNDSFKYFYYNDSAKFNITKQKSKYYENIADSLLSKANIIKSNANLLIQEAILNYSKAIEIMPSNYYAYVQRGDSKIKIKDWKGSIEDFDQAIKLGISVSFVFYERGKAKFMLEKVDEAIIDFNKAIELDSKNYSAYLLRAPLRFGLEDWLGSIYDYNELISLEKKENMLFSHYYNRGRAKLEIKDFQGAIEDFTNSNGYGDAIYLRGETKLGLEDYQGAIADFSQELIKDSINANKENKAARTTVATGSKYTKEDKTNIDLANFDKKIKLEKRNLLFCNRGIAKAKLNDYRGAMLDYNSAIKINPKDDWALTRRALAKAQLKDYKGAILDLNMAINYNSENREAYYSRGVIKMILNQKNSGCLDLSKAGELGHPNAYETIKESCN